MKLNPLWRRYDRLLGPDSAGDVRDELRFHIETKTEELAARGWSREDARREAEREFGDVRAVQQVGERIGGTMERRRRWKEYWSDAVQDVRYAVRILSQAPGFTAVIVLTLALGIGANTAIFSVIDAVVLRPLPVVDPNHLVVLSWTARHAPKLDGRSRFDDCSEDINCDVSVPFFKAVRAETHNFSGVTAFAGPMQVDVNDGGTASMARGEYVSGDFFSTLGVRMQLGRPLGSADDMPSAAPVIVLDYHYWKEHFDSDPAVVGRTVRLNGMEAMIAGVASPRFSSLTPGKSQDFFMPISLVTQVRSQWWRNDDRLTDPAIFWVVVAARLRPGVSMIQAETEISSLFREATLHSGKPMFTSGDAPAIKVLPARQALDGASSFFVPMLNLVMAAVGLVLLIACANVAGLTLARAAKRQKEIAMRQALGARRSRIVRQLLTESMLLSVCGGTLGILVALWGITILTKLMASGAEAPFPFTVVPDWRVLAFTIGITLATGILTGLAQALRGSREDLTPALRENASSTPGAAYTGQQVRAGNLLVAAQVALSVVVLIGAGLLVRTLENLSTLNPGFDTHNVLLFGMAPRYAGYTDKQTSNLYQLLQQRFAALPGVISVSYSEDALLSGGQSGTDVHLDGAAPNVNVNTDVLRVGEDFFPVMRIPLLAGRGFTAADISSAAATQAATSAAEAKAASGTAATAANESANQQPAPEPAPIPVVINQTFAHKYFPNQNPVGRHVGNAQGERPAKGPQPGYRIVGIVADTKYAHLRSEIEPTMFIPLVGEGAHFEIRTAGDPHPLVAAVRQIVAHTDSNVPIFGMLTQSERIEQMLYRERLLSHLSSFFGLLALCLACIGLYGLLAYEVAQRTRELGIRMALGARRRDLMRLVLRQGLLLVLLGAVAGGIAAFGVTRFMAHMLYNVRPDDPATFIAVIAFLILVALAACVIPARRATHVDPMVALRCE